MEEPRSRRIQCHFRKALYVGSGRARRRLPASPKAAHAHALYCCFSRIQKSTRTRARANTEQRRAARKNRAGFVHGERPRRLRRKGGWNSGVLCPHSSPLLALDARTWSGVYLSISRRILTGRPFVLRFLLFFLSFFLLAFGREHRLLFRLFPQRFSSFHG